MSGQKYQIRTSLERPDLNRLEDAAFGENKTVTDYVREIIIDHLNKGEKSRGKKKDK